MQRGWTILLASVLVVAACGNAARPSTSRVALADPSASASAAPVCSDSAPAPYQPHAAWSGAVPDLPPPPTLPEGPLRIGADYTVRGAVRALNARYGQDELKHPITIVGWIVDTNLSRAPRCAVHRRGIADPKGCTSEIPTFTLADAKDDKTGPRVRVMGWASNFSNVVEAYLIYRPLTSPPTTLVQDAIWGGEIPYPIPAVGAKVRVTGRYGVNFTMSSQGLEADPVMGILTVTSTATLERAPSPATLPGLSP
jgi:hypothetical protein